MSYYFEHREESIKKAKLYYQDHKEEAKVRAALWKKLNPEKRKANGLRYYRKHKETVLVKARLHYSKNKYQCYLKSIKLKYGLTKENYNKLLIKQNYKCFLCLRKRKLVVDHNHKTNQIRGLLCQRCNIGIGFLDNTNLVQKAINYVRRFKI